MALCEDCLHFDVCNWLGKTAVFEVDDGVCLFFEPERPKGRRKYYHKRNIAVYTNCSFERKLDADFGKAVTCPNCGTDMRGESE